jgi:hypothetical protein
MAKGLDTMRMPIKLPKIYPWTIVLTLIIVLDSILTSGLVSMGLATEANPLILWAMKTFGLTLDNAMLLRVIALIPFIGIVNHANKGRFVIMCYAVIYVLATLLILI